jgi:hypothetical protein
MSRPYIVSVIVGRERREESVEVKLRGCIVEIEIVNWEAVWGSAVGRKKVDKIFRR